MHLIEPAVIDPFRSFANDSFAVLPGRQQPCPYGPRHASVRRRAVPVLQTITTPISTRRCK